jgi:hypothetical protein
LAMLAVGERPERLALPSFAATAAALAAALKLAAPAMVTKARAKPA